MFQPDLLKGKRILVTGGGTGLGRSMAHRYLELGANVVICGRREDVLKETAAELAKDTGGEIETAGCDVRVPDAVERIALEKLSLAPLNTVVADYVAPKGPGRDYTVNDAAALFPAKLTGRKLADDMSLYVHRPSITDPSVAPLGDDTFYALSPVPHLGFDNGVDWATEAEPYRQKMQKMLEEV